MIKAKTMRKLCMIKLLNCAEMNLVLHKKKISKKGAS